MVTAAAGMVAGCGSPKTKTEVLGVQYTRPEVTTTSAPTPATSPTTSVPRSVTTTSIARRPAKTATSPTTAAPGSIAGRLVAGGQPIAGATATLSTGAGPLGQTTTSSDGTYRFVGVSPGQYRVTMSDHGDSTPVCDEGGSCITKRPASEQIAEVTVASGAVTTADFVS
jgi:hypothetical protein